MPTATPDHRSRLFIGGNLVIVAATIIALRLEGRLWWCSCGRLFLWAGDPLSSHCSQHLLDPYAFTHLLHGVGYCGILALLVPRLSAPWSFTWSMLAECLWEVLENSQFVVDRYRNETAALGYTGDSIINSVGDIAASAAGWWLARMLGWKWSIVLFITLELVLLVWIRDNLTLNIVMLIWPMESLKHWQLGL